MKKSKYTETQIVAAIKKQESGITTREVCRELGISDATFYNWKSKYAGMEVNQVKQLKELQEENRKLKAMYADLALDHRILKEIIELRTIAREIVAFVEDFGKDRLDGCYLRSNRDFAAELFF